MILIVEVAWNFSVKIWKEEIWYKLNITVHKGLYLALNDKLYNVTYNAHIEETLFWCAKRCLATENCG